MRNITFDIIKGFAIFLVVVGHLLQYSMVDYDHNILWRYIYSFHMPLFFFISGFFSFYSKKAGIILVFNRFKSLMIPFFVWAIIYYYIRDNMGLGLLEYLKELILVPDKGLWFLWVLFFCYIVLVLIKCIPVNLYLVFFISILFFFVIGLVLKDKIFGINLIAKQLPFFFLGYSVGQYKNLVFDILLKIKYTVFLLFILGAFCWMRKEDPLFYSYINLGSLFKLGYIIIVGVLGIFSTLLLFININENSTNFFLEKLAFIGKHTLSIYVLHFILLDYIKLGELNLWIYSLLIFVYSILIIFLCIRIEQIISLNKIASKILFGK